MFNDSISENLLTNFLLRICNNGLWFFNRSFMRSLLHYLYTNVCKEWKRSSLVSYTCNGKVTRKIRLLKDNRFRIKTR